MSNDFEKIQKIYEEGFRGQHAILRSYGPNMKYTPGKAPPGYTLSNTPGHLPLASPDTGKQRPVGGEGAMQGLTVPIDEEGAIEKASIINHDVLDKVDELLDEAEKDEMEYAILQLSRLREHVISLSQGKRD